MKKAADAKGKGRPLPPWLQKGKGDEADDSGKGAKVATAKGPFGKATVVKKADGGSVTKVKSKVQPKSAAKSDPKMACNAKPNNNLNTMHLKDGGKVKC